MLPGSVPSLCGVRTIFMFKFTCCAPSGSAAEPGQIDSFPPSLANPADGALDCGLDDCPADACVAEGSELDSCANRVQVSIDGSERGVTLPEPEPEAACPQLPEADEEREPTEGAREQLGQAVSIEEKVSAEVEKKEEEMQEEASSKPERKVSPVDRKPVDIVVKVGRRAKHLGLEIESPFATSLTVLRVNEGAIMAWNRLNPEIAIRHGYSIVKVNNCEPLAAVLEEKLLKEPVPLYIAFRTPLEWQATLWKYAGAKIGLEVALSADTSLIIRQVKDGIVQEYNRANPQSPVVVCDRIISVNGIDDDPRKILGALGNSERLDIVFSRSNV